VGVKNKRPGLAEAVKLWGDGADRRQDGLWSKLELIKNVRRRYGPKTTGTDPNSFTCAPDG
jgi:hypothetical protein